MAQKIFKVGSSAAITLSPEVLKTLKAKIGDTVDVKTSSTASAASIVPTKRKRSGVSHELIEWIDNAIERYRPALEALADK